MGHAFEHKVTACLTEVAGGRITILPTHNDRVSPGHHKRPQDGGQMNSERRPDGGGRDSTDVLTRTARAPDLVLRYGDGAEQVAAGPAPSMMSRRPWTGCLGWSPSRLTDAWPPTRPVSCLPGTRLGGIWHSGRRAGIGCRRDRGGIPGALGGVALSRWRR